MGLQKYYRVCVRMSSYYTMRPPLRMYSLPALAPHNICSIHSLLISSPTVLQLALAASASKPDCAGEC